MAFRFAICEDGDGLETALGGRTSSGDRESDGPLCYFSSCAALRQAMEAGTRFDIVLFDLRQGDGAGLARMLELFPDTSGTQVICVATPGICATVPPQRNVRFLDRPLGADALTDILQQTLAELRRRQGDALPVHAGGRVLQLPAAQITYIASGSGSLQIYMADGRTVETHTALAGLCCKLGGAFVRCHKSYMVNLAQVRELDQNAFVLADCTRVPVSRRRYTGMQRAYISWKTGMPAESACPAAQAKRRTKAKKILDLE